MAIVHHNIRSTSAVIDHVDALQAFPIDLLPEDRAAHDAVAKHPKLEEGQCNSLGKEHFTNLGWDASECIADDSDDNILEESSPLHKWRALIPRSKALAHKLVWHLQYCTTVSTMLYLCIQPTERTQKGKCFDAAYCRFYQPNVNDQLRCKEN